MTLDKSSKKTIKEEKHPEKMEGIEHENPQAEVWELLNRMKDF